MKSKLKRFAEFSESSLGVEHSDSDIATNVNAFVNRFDRVVLELACGKAEYTVALAELSQDVGHIGIDIQGERLWHGVRESQNKGLDNVLFVRAYIDQIQEYIPRQSIDEVWIAFPDPFPRKRQAKKRLISQGFLELYSPILKPGAVLNLKTDNTDLYNYALDTIPASSGEILFSTDDIDLVDEIAELKITTTFERKHRLKGDKIKFVRFLLN